MAAFLETPLGSVAGCTALIALSAAVLTASALISLKLYEHREL